MSNGQRPAHKLFCCAKSFYIVEAICINAMFSSVLPADDISDQREVSQINPTHGHNVQMCKHKMEGPDLSQKVLTVWATQGVGLAETTSQLSMRKTI